MCCPMAAASSVGWMVGSPRTLQSSSARRALCENHEDGFPRNVPLMQVSRGPTHGCGVHCYRQLFHISDAVALPGGARHFRIGYASHGQRTGNGCSVVVGKKRGNSEEKREHLVAPNIWRSYHDWTRSCSTCALRPIFLLGTSNTTVTSESRMRVSMIGISRTIHGIM